MNKTVKTMMISMIVNTILSISKVLVGLIGKSGALIADGLHSFSDLITDVVAIIGSKLASKPADLNHPYGHGKIEYITSMVISMMIIFLGSTIVIKTFTEDITIPSKIVIIVTIFTILSKLLLSNYILKCGKKYNSNILISSGLESRTDVISSIVVLISSILCSLNEYVKIFKYADKVAMLIVSILIIKTGFNLLKENISNILGESEINTELTSEVEKIILNNKEVIKIDELVLIKYGSYYKLISDIGMNENNSLKDVHDVLDLLEEKIKKETNIKFITFHVNPYKIED